jgi:hypothetical protein
MRKKYVTIKLAVWQNLLKRDGDSSKATKSLTDFRIQRSDKAFHHSVMQLSKTRNLQEYSVNI